MLVFVLLVFDTFYKYLYFSSIINTASLPNFIYPSFKQSLLGPLHCVILSASIFTVFKRLKRKIKCSKIYSIRSFLLRKIQLTYRESLGLQFNG